MQVQLNHEDLLILCKEHLDNLGIPTKDKDISYTYTAKRKNAGITLTINISNKSFDSEESVKEEIKPSPTIYTNLPFVDSEVDSSNHVPVKDITEEPKPVIKGLFE